MLAGVSRRTTPIFEWLTALPETYINRGTVTCTVTEALSARHAVPAAARIATTRTKTTKIPARRRILTTYATNQHTFDFGSRKRTLVGTNSDRWRYIGMKVGTTRVAGKSPLSMRAGHPNSSLAGFESSPSREARS